MPLSNVLTPRRVHLLGGLSDAGKTRFIIPQMVAWENAPPWVYVVGDRTLEEAQDTIRSMGIDPAVVPTLPAFGEHNKSSWLEVKIGLNSMFPHAEILVIEGFQDLCPDQQRRSEVRNFLSDVHSSIGIDINHPNGRSILGIMESPKQKPHEKYANPRQRISGPSGWGYHSSSVMLIEADADDPEFKGPNRVMWVCHKNAPRQELNGVFDKNNRLLFPLL